MPPNCPPDELLSQFLLEQLTPTRENALESHLQGCDDCRNRMEQLAADWEVAPSMSVSVLPPLKPEFAQRLEDSLRDSLSTSNGESEQAAPEIPGYELLEVIGRGGSSIVFRAREESLQRIVAIKILHDRAVGTDRERFSREAKALASLRHPNITRAHGVGEANGRLYLVMEYVPGGSLGKHVAGVPQPPLGAARLVRQLAYAMQAAHAAGFVHRDLKPTNVLLDAHFDQGETTGLDRYVPKVTDLGVVKDLSRDDDFTQTRDCLGTPSYMAPEQVKGSTQTVDCRTDVYALGAVLYELLTGRPPFRAGSPLDTMLQVKHDEPVTPSRFHPQLPCDLETICLKCLEKEPSRRYQTAQLLADDLDRYVKGQPILARRTRWPSRLLRWSRRNPGWAAAAILSLTLLLTLAIGGPLLAQRERQLRKQAIDQQKKAQSERTRAREQAELASNAVDKTLEQVLRSARLQDTALDDVRSSLVREALPYYEHVVQVDDPERSMRLRQGRVLLQLAQVHSKEQHPDKAREGYRRSLKLLESVAAENPSLDPPTQFSLASAHLEFGRFLQVSENNLEGAEKEFRQALALQKELLDRQPNDPVRRDTTAITLSLLGTLFQTWPGRASEAQNYMSQAIAIRDGLLADFPLRDDLRHYAALCHYNLGMVHRQLNNNEEEVSEFRMALEQHQPLSKSASARLETPFILSMLEGELGIAYGRDGQRQPAMRHLRAAIRVAEALEATYPGVAKYSDLRRQHQEVLDYLLKQR